MKIICGFAGIGKSYAGKNIAGVIDLESTPFNKNWNLYSDVAIHMQKQGYTVLVSCHKELRNILKDKKANYLVIIPKKEDKDKYLDIYRIRGNTPEFIEMMDNKWESFIDEIKDNENDYLELNNTLSDDLILTN